MTDKKLPPDTTLLEFFETKYKPRRLLGRSKDTARLHRATIKSFSGFLGRDAILSDLNDDTVAEYLSWYSEQPQVKSVRTINNKRSYIRALWEFAARKRYVEEFPDIQTLPVPEFTPKAWTTDDIVKLLASCEQERNQVGRHPGQLYWRMFLIFCLDTGERSGATLGMKWEHLDLETGVVRLPAEIRKGKVKPARYTIRDETREGLKLMRALAPNDELVFGEMQITRPTWYCRYHEIVKRAGLPSGRHDKMHKLRRTYATYVAASGGDATAALMHSDPRITQKSYLDQEMLQKDAPVYRVPIEKGGAA